MRSILALAVLLLLPAAQAASQETPARHAVPPDVQRGMLFAKENCSRCHAIDKVSPSPLQAAPPFRTLHQRYNVEDLEESLAEGIVTGHPSMPEFQLDPDQIGDFIAFLESLE